MPIKQFDTEAYPGNGQFKSLTATWHKEPYPRISPSRPELTANGKVIFITGGGSGIGKATAIAFAEAGAKTIAIFGRRVEKLESAAREIQKANSAVTVIPVSVDLSQRTAVDKAFENAAQQAGGAAVDIFISNAGILQELGTVSGYKEEHFRKGLESNMLSTFNAVQSILPHLAPKAKVFDVSSGIAHISPIPGVWAYAATKAANTKLFQYLQAENPELHVVSIQPGVIVTEINANTYFETQDDINLPGHFQVWLASPEAEFLKGKFVWANWDVDELISGAEQIRDPLALQVLLNGVPM
ncbi:hypothetical protein H2198_000882 [Neophaeococcomyces mojaviensis]|uniref:Uncharacterized protein n=1 Tax=Neophaeococcomyces mojaviensis TaxID=3383035 RepID=A0ACC3AIP8_9EURO|nr:hypothetical protein H2198_000882 [Knufia sp. JES_112]